VSLRDLSSIFGRYFLVGFFVPALTSLAIAAIVLDASDVPALKDDPSVLSRLTILVGIALFAALVLFGVRRPIIRLLEGYPLEEARRRHGLQGRAWCPPWLRPSWPGFRLRLVLVGRQERAFERLCRDSSDVARRRRERMFPHTKEFVLPTRLGNVLRSFEHHSDVRWGLGGLAAWPRVAALLNDRERDLHADAETDFMFFVNCCVCSALLVPTLAIGVGGTAPLWAAVSTIVAALACYAFYRGAVVAAVSWGTEVRASLDLHRFELYERLGVRLPASFSDERFIAWHVTRMIEFGEPLPDRLWGPLTWR
jgi:hypothetical protein